MTNDGRIVSARPVTRRQMLYGVASAGVLAGASPFLAGCENSGSPTGTSGSAKLVVWEQQSSIQGMKSAIAAFSKRYPHITIDWVPVQIHDTATKLLAALTAGSGAPDLAYIEYGDMGKFTAVGGAGLEDLSTRMSKPPYSLTQWWKPAIDIATTSSGKIIGLPVDYGAMGTFYRRDAFAAAKLAADPASVQDQLKTWESFIATGQAMRKAGRYMVTSAYDVFNIARQQHMQAFFAQDGKPAVDDDEYIAAAELAQRVRSSGIDLNPPDVFAYITNGLSVTASPSAAAAFKNGSVAIQFSAAWEEIVISALAPQTKGDWGVTLLPQGSRANLGGSYWVLPTGAHAEEAWSLASFVLASKQGMQQFLTGSLFLPTWKPAYTVPAFKAPSPYFGTEVWLPEFATLAAQDPALVVTPNDSIAQTALAQAMVDILGSRASAKQRLTTAANQITAQVKRLS